jgi:hypothetical protein
VQPKKSPVDQRPFQSKADREREVSLEAKYLNVAIPELAAALKQAKDTGDSKQG